LKRLRTVVGGQPERQQIALEEQRVRVAGGDAAARDGVVEDLRNRRPEGAMSIAS
jgi:hypothetical protein